MARIRDLLRLVEGHRDEVHATLPMPRAFTPTISPESEEMPAADEVPFIEVGGKNQPMEGSAAVLAVPMPAQSAKPSPVMNQESEVRGQGPEKQSRRSDPSPLTPDPYSGFTFMPLPAGPLPLHPPSRRFVPELIAFHQPDHPLSLQCRQLLEAIEAQLPASQAHVVLFAGFTPDADTTTVLLNMAITRARRQSGDAVVIDADLRFPCVHERLGLYAQPGLRDVLAGSASLQRAIQETGQPNLYALTAGQAKADDPGFLAGQAMRSILRHLRERFNLTLIDAPYWDGRADLVSLAGVCDAVYLVLAESELETSGVKQLTRIIALEGVSLRGYISLPG
jgi:Mrp family chromosome partitioning ATPase